MTALIEHIKAGGRVVTGDDREVAIYCVDSAGDYPIHARVDGWLKTGRFSALGKSEHFWSRLVAVQPSFKSRALEALRAIPPLTPDDYARAARVLAAEVWAAAVAHAISIIESLEE